MAARGRVVAAAGSRRNVVGSSPQRGAAEYGTRDGSALRRGGRHGLGRQRMEDHAPVPRRGGRHPNPLDRWPVGAPSRVGLEPPRDLSDPSSGTSQAGRARRPEGTRVGAGQPRVLRPPLRDPGPRPRAGWRGGRDGRWPSPRRGGRNANASDTSPVGYPLGGCPPAADPRPPRPRGNPSSPSSSAHIPRKHVPLPDADLTLHLGRDRRQRPAAALQPEHLAMGLHRQLAHIVAVDQHARLVQILRRGE